MTGPEQAAPENSPNKTFLALVGGTGLIGLAAYGLSFLFKTPLGEQITLSGQAVALGFIATAPLALFLLWFMRTRNSYLAAFRQSQVEFFAAIGFEFTWPRIVMMALAAGICEELLFRGVFQTYADRFMPVIAAILLTNLVFGALHWRTALYAAIAGLVGIYLGGLYWISGSLTAPIITHALYDFIALWFTRDAIKAYKAEVKTS